MGWEGDGGGGARRPILVAVWSPAEAEAEAEILAEILAAESHVGAAVALVVDSDNDGDGV